jgi:hypothetical protein
MQRCGASVHAPPLLRRALPSPSWAAVLPARRALPPRRFAAPACAAGRGDRPLPRRTVRLPSERDAPARRAPTHDRAREKLISGA